MDWYDRKYYEECKKQGIVENPAGPETGSFRMLRGGSWDNSGRNCRSALRNGNSPVTRNINIGFRLVLVP